MKFRQPYISFIVTSLLLSVFVYSTLSIDETFVLNQHTQLANDAVDAKILHPFTHISVDITKEINAITLHFANREYRLLLPVIGNVLQIKSNQLTSFQIYLLPFVLLFLCIFFYRNLKNHVLAMLLTATLINSYVCLCFFQKFPFFDAYALFIMLLIMLCQNRICLFILYLTGFLLDERMLLSSGLILLLKQYLENKNFSFNAFFSYLIQKQLVFIIAVGVYFLIRLILILKCDFYATPSTYLFFTKSAIINNIRGGFLSFIYTYKAWSVIVFLNLFLAIKQEKYQLYITLFAAILLMLLSCVFVYDFSRIQLYFLPFIIWNVFLFLSSAMKIHKKYIYIVFIIFFINLVLPSKIVYGGLRNKTQDINTLWSR